MSPGRIVAARAKVSGWLSAVPLRVTLMVLLVLTAGLGLLVSGMVVTSALEQQLTNRTDQQLHGVATEWSRRGQPPISGGRRSRAYCLIFPSLSNCET